MQSISVGLSPAAIKFENVTALTGMPMLAIVFYVRELADVFVQQHIVSVSPYLLKFPGTLRQNLDPLYGTRAQNCLPDDIVVDVLKKLTLWRAVVARGATLDSPMSAMGLSRGQREVLSVARAILRQKHLGVKIVMVDGTLSTLSTVDPTLDLLVNQVMAEEFQGCTLIKVTHHLATLDDARRRFTGNQAS